MHSAGSPKEPPDSLQVNAELTRQDKQVTEDLAELTKQIHALISEHRTE
jgi:hypothetical protein